MSEATPVLEVRGLEQRFAVGGSLFDRLRIENGMPRLVNPIVHAVNVAIVAVAQHQQALVAQML